MRKVVSLLIISIMILSVFYTVNAEKTDISDITLQADSVVSLSSTTVGLNTEFYLILNLSKIAHSKFEVEIISSEKLATPEFTSNNVSDVSINKDGVVVFTIDNSDGALNRFGIIYTSPEEESKITFTVKIKGKDYTQDELNQEIEKYETEKSSAQSNYDTAKDTYNTAENAYNIAKETYDEAKGFYDTLVSEGEDAENYETIMNEATEKMDKATEIMTSSKSTMSELMGTIALATKNITELTNKLENAGISEKLVLTVSEAQADDSKMSAWGEKDSILDDMEDMKGMNKEMSTSMKKMMEQMNNLESDLKSANDKISSLTQTVKYQGSQNNYLASLNITGVEFKNNFNKTNTSYFATVDSNVTSVTVNATAEDSSSIVTIYGNTNLQEGQNKIIINVTAVDGSVRTYKIYVTK